MGVLSALILILWGFRPMVLLSIFCFSLLPTWLHDENADYQHLYQVIMGSCTLIVGVIKYFLIFWVLSALILILWFFRPMVLLSIFAFLCPPTWSHDKNVDYSHLHQVIMGSCTLIVRVLKYFLIFSGFLSALILILWAFALWCFCPFNEWKMNCYVLYGIVKKVLCPLWPTVNGAFMFFVPKVAIKKVFLLLVWLLQSNCLLVV